ncbi:MAG: UDP-N-acetylglucosamine pyrophosphorylase [Clostridia bacterium]|nr:UDP-N-acetylglucosamine pyrophosphorylase [Clostridia bacterium]
MKQYLCENLFDLRHTLARDAIRGEYAWEVPGMLGDIVLALGQTLDPSEWENPQAGVWISRTASLEEGATVRGPAIIGPDTEVRAGAYLRGGVLIGRGCVVGHATEIKNSLLFDGAKAPHFNYVGDSVLGWGAHIGAGTILSNVRCDREKIVIRTDPPVSTLLRKLGAVLGDGCEVGCGCVLNPGTLLGPGCTVMPLSSVRGVFRGGSRIATRRG